jgi:monothiol glutaredoxin
MRKILSNDNLDPAAALAIASYHSSVVEEVSQAIASNKVVVVGMAANPFVKKACKALEEKNISYKYLGYGGYLSKWKERLAIKLWSGWATYPQVFVNGKLVGGFMDLKKFIAEEKL